MWKLFRRLFWWSLTTYEPILPVRRHSKKAASNGCVPRVATIKHELEYANERYISFRLKESTSRRSFFDALLPGDIILGTDSTYLLRSIEKQSGKKKVWHFLEKNLRMGILVSRSFTEKELRAIDAVQAYSRKQQLFDDVEDLDEYILLKNLRFYYGVQRGQDSVHDLHAHQVDPIFLGVDANDGSLTGAADTLDDALDLGVVLKVSTSSLFEFNRPRLLQSEAYGELSDEARAHVHETIRLINCFEYIGRLKLCESISG